MATLNALKRAPILDQDGAHINGDFGVTSTDQAVARVGLASPNNWYAIGVAAGSATITATRPVDGAVATLEVTVHRGCPFRHQPRGRGPRLTPC